MITRRGFLRGIAAMAVGTIGLGGYAFGIEPGLRMRVQRYRVTPPRWPAGFRLNLAVIADIHACKPWMNIARVEGIVESAMALDADAILLLGDYSASHRFVTDWVHSRDWSRALAGLRAPLGVHAILGNHDWWKDRDAQARGAGPTFGRIALEGVGIPVYENDVVRLERDGHGFWLAGLGDQLALLPGARWGRSRFVGVDDLSGTLAQVTDDAPIILLAHEPDIFPEVPDRVALTLSGHTHGGQVRLFGYSPVVPSRFGDRYAYGHITERRFGFTRRDTASVATPERHLIVSGGLGCSIAPVRFGVPPEIVHIEIGRA